MYCTEVKNIINHTMHTDRKAIAKHDLELRKQEIIESKLVKK